ncbi:hypothetical protein KUV46_15690 [Thalassovita mediterranea]|nr:hypothetical protein KUV46_15690 [Thalassovita mediterranea]
MSEPLDKDEALARFRVALDTLGREPGAETSVHTALEAARRDLAMLMFALEMAGQTSDAD